MKFLLLLHVNPQVWNALTADEQNEVMNGHEAFIDVIKKSGELITTHGLAEPSESAVVRVRDGRTVVTDGPYLEAKEHLGGYYVIDCESRERAVELAAMIPDAKLNGLGVEVRQIMYTDGELDT